MVTTRTQLECESRVLGASSRDMLMLGESRAIKEAEAQRSATRWKAPALQGTLLKKLRAGILGW